MLLGRQGERLEQFDEARAAMEVRCQRAVSQGGRIREILAGIGDPIIAVDGYDELLLANPAAEELFEFSADGGRQRALNQLVHCQKLLDLLATSASRKTPGVRAEEVQIEDRQGRPVWFRVEAAQLALAEEGPDGPASGGAVAVLRDISALKSLQQRNAEFVSAVSHEMKTPLAGIKAYVELLADGDAEDDETRQQFLNVIDSQADRLRRLVDNLLNLARIEAGVVQVNKQSRPVNEILEEAAKVVRPTAEAKRITLTADLSPLYLGVLADRDLLLQAAINLLSNAIKYTPEGGRVTLRSRSADDRVLFEVEDTGVGLSEEDSQKVFEKFYRVKKDQKMASGTGLGLPLAKHIVEDVHGGRIAVRSQLGAGSTFTVTLPTAAQMG
jgi:two-component system, OmpR family, phosphate regulon sensor histidine kinase PhoR